MQRACVSLAVSVVIACAVAAGTASDARALSAPTPNPLTLQENWNAVQNFVRAGFTATQEATLPATVAGQEAIATATIDAGAIPAFEAIPQLTLAAGALYVGWKIGRTADTKWLNIRCHVGGTCGDTTPGSTLLTYTGANVRWLWNASPRAWEIAAVPGCSAGCWELETTITPGPTTARHWTTTTPAAGSFPALLSAMNLVGLGSTIQTTSSTGSVPSCNTNPGVFTCAMHVASPAQMNAGTDMSRPTTWDSTMPATVATTGYAPLNNCAWGSACQTTVVSDLTSDDGTATAIGKILDPSWNSGGETGTITLPDPDTDETVPEYLARLRASGYLGTVTTVTETTFPSGYPEYDPRYGPNAPVRITVPTTTGTPVYFPSPGYAWPGPGSPPGPDPDPNEWPDPDNPPTIGPKTPITISKNPPTYSGGVVPPAPTDGGGGGSCEVVSIESLDFGPVSELDLGDRFPFGVLTWFGNVLADLTPGRVSPSYTFEGATVGGYHLPDYTIDLSWADSYMSTIRTMIAFALVAMGVWYFATGLLGIRGGMGEPVDSHDVGEGWH